MLPHTIILATLKYQYSKHNEDNEKIQMLQKSQKCNRDTK